MQDVDLDYGDSVISAELPDTATIVEYGKTYTDPEGVDPAQAVRKAIDSPLGFPPLRELVGANKKMTLPVSEINDA